MIQNRFVVYKAGAGSGKTFQIAKRYLNRLIQAQNSQMIYRLIGITFTNKAAEEMKKRIIDNLISASKGQITDVMAAVSQESKAIIKQQTGISKDVDYQQEIIKRSRQRLTEILHYYDEFQLTTIDKLMYKIIKTFARDMHLSTDVEVEMDYKEVVSNLIDQLINHAEPDSLLSRFFIDFALENLDDERHWDIKNNLLLINKIIFDDNHFEVLKTLENKTLSDFVKLKKFLKKEIRSISKQLVDFGNALEQTYQAYQVYINKSLNTLVRKLKFEHHQIEVVDTIRNKLNEENYVYYVKSKLQELHIDEQNLLKGSINDDIHHILTRAVPYIDANLERYFLLKAILKEVNALSIENELQKEIASYKETHNRIFISDFNKLILEQILKDLSGDTPYIYMRLGEKYAHYFIDEFQDTSALQWQNLMPLVRETLSKEFAGGQAGTAMLVGDAKQSIYRFRGGKPEQFIALSNPDLQDGDGNPFAAITGKNVETLPFNWRSKEHVINFNNDFFKNFSLYLDEPYCQVYMDPTQKIPPDRKTGEGYVNIRFLKGPRGPEKEDFEEAVFEAIQQAEQNGFQKEEICILVNTNNEGKKIAGFLSQNNIEVVSSESLLVANAGKVRFLTGWLHFLHSGNPLDLYDAVGYLAERDEMPKSEYYESLINDKNISKKDQVKAFEKIGYHVDYERLIKFNLYDALIYLIDIFGLSDSNEQAYLQAFLEKVYQFNQKDLSGLKPFLDEWQIIAKDFSIDAPEQQGAVKIMTVHKAKGLEFPVVIYYTDEAVLDSRDKETKVWIPVNPQNFQGFNILPVEMKALEESTNEVYRQIYQKTASEKTFDNLNRIYVALTRAVEQLFVITYQPPKNSKNLKVSQIFRDYLSRYHADFDGICFEYGMPVRKKQKSESEPAKSDVAKLHYQNWQFRKDDNFLKINTLSFERWSDQKQSAIRYGMQLHEILSHITTVTQWESQKQKYLSGLDISLQNKITEIIEKILNHPDLSLYFTGEYQILNERDILIPSTKGIFKQKRPDRLLIKDGKIIIIDYKTGAENYQHSLQLQNYAIYLSQAGFVVESKFLVYLNDAVYVKYV